MGITYVSGAVRGPTGKEAVVEFLVDSGAAYSLNLGLMFNPFSMTLHPLRALIV